MCGTTAVSLNALRAFESAARNLSFTLAVAMMNEIEAIANKAIAVRSRIEARGKRHDDGNVGRTSHFLFKLDTSHSPALGHVIANLRDGLDLDGPAGTDIAARAYRIKEAAKVLPLGTQQMAELRRTNALLAILGLRAGRCDLLLDREEIHRLKEEIRLRMGFDSVRCVFGIPHEGVAQLVELGLLDHPFHLARYGIHQSTQASFDRLTADLIANQSPLNITKCIRVTQAMKAIGGRFKAWGPAFQAFVAGRTAYTIHGTSGPVAHRIHILTTDAPQVAAPTFTPATPPRLIPATLMSKADAMEILNIAARQVTDLFADVPTSKGGRQKTLVVADILAMARGSVATAELAAGGGPQHNRHMLTPYVPELKATELPGSSG